MEEFATQVSYDPEQYPPAYVQHLKDRAVSDFAEKLVRHLQSDRKIYTVEIIDKEFPASYNKMVYYITARIGVVQQHEFHVYAPPRYDEMSRIALSVSAIDEIKRRVKTWWRKTWKKAV